MCFRPVSYGVHAWPLPLVKVPYPPKVCPCACARALVRVLRLCGGGRSRRAHRCWFVNSFVSPRTPLIVLQSGEVFRHFAAAVLNGEVVPALAAMTPHLTSSPSFVTKPWTHPKIAAIVQPLINAKVGRNQFFIFALCAPAPKRMLETLLTTRTLVRSVTISGRSTRERRSSPPGPTTRGSSSPPTSDGWTRNATARCWRCGRRWAAVTRASSKKRGQV